MEKESLRVTPRGFLPGTPHPFGPDSKVQRDFCNDQTEIITDVKENVESVCDELRQIHETAARILANRSEGAEYLWPFSNPPYVRGDADILVADYSGVRKSWREYREYLAEKYGKRKMLFCGIHFNFSFTDEMLDLIGIQTGNHDRQQLKNEIYLDLSEKLIRYSWLIVCLTAASPVLDDSFFENGTMGQTAEVHYASPRCGSEGYWNDFVPVLDYRSVQCYADSIEKYVLDGTLKAEKELYYPIRLKPRGEYSLGKLREKGINHMELRMLDVNPFSSYGVMPQDLHFIHYLILYLLSGRSGEENQENISDDAQMDAIDNMKRAAEYPNEKTVISWTAGEKIPLRILAISVLDDMQNFFDEIGVGDVVREVMDFEKNKVLSPDQCYAARVVRDYGSDFVKRGIVLARRYTGQAKSNQRGEYIEYV